MKAPSNIRNLEVTTSSGTDVKETSMLKGESRATKSVENVTKQATAGALPRGNAGGENTNS